MCAGECMHWKSEIDIGYVPLSNLRLVFGDRISVTEPGIH